MSPVTHSHHSAHATRIAYVVGARPNFVKMAPVISELRRRMPDGRHALIHTGQHYDRLMSDVFLEDLGVPAPDHMLGVGSASHAVQTARVMERIEPVLEAERPNLVIVPGDVTSTLAATLVAVKLSIPVAHLESGVRSFDRTMPEEINRIVADEFSEYLFLHSDEAVENLQAEGIADERMHFVGNTMIDSLQRAGDHLADSPRLQPALGESCAGRRRARARLARCRALLDGAMYCATHSHYPVRATPIAYVVGARPNFVELAPIIAEPLAPAAAEAHRRVTEGTDHG